MARKNRNAVRKSLKSANYRDNNDNVTPLHPLGISWEATENTRDRSYVKNVTPQNESQRKLMEAMDSFTLSMAVGPAGTGKTFLAISAAVKALEKGNVGRIVLSRPAVEAGESLGFLPGSMEEKLLPYLRPLYDALGARMGHKRLKAALSDGSIEIVPLAYMRGRTFNNCFIVVDEAQNCTYGQIKMLLTRLGWHSKMVMTGDPDQSDLLDGLSGLSDIANRLSVLDDVGLVEMDKKDVVRHPLVSDMLSVL